MRTQGSEGRATEDELQADDTEQDHRVLSQIDRLETLAISVRNLIKQGDLTDALGLAETLIGELHAMKVLEYDDVQRHKLRGEVQAVRHRAEKAQERSRRAALREDLPLSFGRAE